MLPPRRKPKGPGSIQHGTISELELAEFRQNGMIRVKPFPPVLGYHHHYHTYKFYQSIDIQGILGGAELSTWDPELELGLIAKVIQTEYGIIGMEDKGDHYLLDVAEKYHRRSVIRDLEWNGCQARIVDGGFVCVYKEELIYD